MTYTVTFYAPGPNLGEVAVTVHRVEKIGLIAYTGAPAIALAVVRTLRGEPKADGFNVVDPGGRVLLNQVDKVGRG